MSGKFDRILRLTALRIKIQQVLERMTTTSMLSMVTLLIGLYYYKTYALGVSAMWVFFVLAGGWLLAGLVWGLTAKTPASLVASRLDETCGLNDALGSALEFSARKEQAHPVRRALMELEIRRAERVVQNASGKKAQPFRLPRDFAPASALFLFLLGFIMVEIPMGKAGVMMVAPPQQEEVPVLTVDAARLEEHLDMLEDLKKRASELGDEELEKFLKQQAALIEEIQKGNMPRRDFMKHYAALMNKFFKGEDDILKNFEAMKDVFKEAAEPFLKSRVAKELGEALKEGDMEKAREELERLLKKMEEKKLTPAQERQLKRALERAAEALRKDKAAQRFAERLQRQSQQLGSEINKLNESIRRLEKQADRDSEQQRELDRMREQKERLEKQRERMQQQKRMVESLQRQMEKSGQQKMSKEMQEEMRKLMEEMSRYSNQAQRSQARSDGRTSLEDLRELLQRMRAQQKRGGKGRLNDFLDRARGGQERGGSGGQGEDGKEGDGSCKEGGRKGAGLTPGRGPSGQGLSRGKGAGDSRGDSKGEQGGGEGGKKWGDTPGGDPIGRETTMDSTRHDEHLSGEEGEGPSSDQIVSGSAEKGFNTTGYRRLYVRYRKLQKEVLQEEDVPAGYRYYIKRYFRLIRSRE